MVATVFKGETLRSMLLNAYGWWKVSQITYIAAIVAFALGGLILLTSASPWPPAASPPPRQTPSRPGRPTSRSHDPSQDDPTKQNTPSPATAPASPIGGAGRRRPG